MTYAEKVREVAPDFIRDNGEPMFCPSLYFELHDPDCAPITCDYCWNREYQGEPVRYYVINGVRNGKSAFELSL